MLRSPYKHITPWNYIRINTTSKLVTFLLLVVTLGVFVTCYNTDDNVDANSTVDDILKCGKKSTYAGNNDVQQISGTYIILGIDSLDGWMIDIKNNGDLHLLQKFEGGWLILDRGELDVDRDGSEFIIHSALDIMNGSFYKCEYVLLNATLGIKFYFLRK